MTRVIMMHRNRELMLGQRRVRGEDCEQYWPTAKSMVTVRVNSLLHCHKRCGKTTEPRWPKPESKLPAQFDPCGVRLIGTKNKQAEEPVFIHSLGFSRTESKILSMMYHIFKKLNAPNLTVNKSKQNMFTIRYFFCRGFRFSVTVGVDASHRWWMNWKADYDRSDANRPVIDVNV